MKTEKYFRKDYTGIKAEDLLLDEAFVEWVKYGEGNQNLDGYWKAISQRYPDLAGEIERAIYLIKAFTSENQEDNNAGRDASWNKIRARMDKTGYRGTISLVRHLVVRYQAVAAIIGILVLLTGALWTGYNIQRRAIDSLSGYYTTIYSPAGQKTEITLPDSSRVWLNAKTTLTYSSGFNVDNRNIYLDGEAYFSVVKGSVPFLVRTEAINIKVLGTEFNVKCYKEESIVEATLVSGSMEVERTSAESGTPETILLKPNQKIVFSRITDEVLNNMVQRVERPAAREIHTTSPPSLPVEQIDLIKAYDTRKSTGWVDGLLFVEAETLLELSLKLERRYDVTIVFMSEDLKEFRYTGTLREYSLEQVLAVIAATSPVKYRIDEQVVYIGKNEESITNYLRVTREKR